MNKNTWIAIIVIGVLVIAGLIWYRDKRREATESYSGSQQSQMAESNPSSAAGTTASSTEPSPAPKTSAAPKPTVDYAKALNTYQYRIQFSQCHGIVNNSPNVGTLSIKQGVKFMLDNRDPVAHTIAFKGVSVKIGAYGYAIVSAPYKGTFNVTCDGGGAAVINVE